MNKAVIKTTGSIRRCLTKKPLLLRDPPTLERERLDPSRWPNLLEASTTFAGRSRHITSGGRAVLQVARFRA